MKLVVRMEDLDCAHCAQKMEDKIGKLSGVESVSVSFMAQKMILQVAEGKLEAHEYLNALKDGKLKESAQFSEQFQRYRRVGRFKRNVLR